MNKVFFENGFLTSTEAQNVCNIANELVGGLQEQLNNLSFYNEIISSIVNPSQGLTSKIGIKDVDWIPEALHKIGKYNAICAWLKEAIKYKEELLNNIEPMQIENMPKAPTRPILPKTILEDEALYTIWDSNKLNKYFSLEAKAAAFGKALSQSSSGNFADARKKLTRILTEPNKTMGTGQDTIVYSYEPSVNKDIVDNMQMALMKKHRELNAELNKMKSELKSTVDKLNRDNLSNYDKELDKYNLEYSEYQTQVAKNNIAAQTYLTNKKQEISALKINVPKDLMSTYKELKELIA